MIARSLFILSVVFDSLVFGQYSGNPCTVKRGSRPGTCKLIDDCPPVISAIAARRRYTLCGYENQKQFVCCPTPRMKTTTAPAPALDEHARISQRKCEEYSQAIYQLAPRVHLVGQLSPVRTLNQCGHKVKPLIVGGELADPKEFPHMTAVGFEVCEDVVVWACGGTLISDQFVLTAGHCLNFEPLGEPKFVRLGDLNLISDDDIAQPQTFNISTVIRHPEYKAGAKYHDIGLLKLSEKVVFDAYILPACLPASNDITSNESIASGWGSTETAGKRSNHLRKVTLEYFSHEECNRIHGGQGTENNVIRDDIQICAGSKKFIRDTCQGDSGGPLQIYHPSIYCMYTVVGITSFGILCGQTGGVYTRVFPYIDWIEKNVWG